MKDCPFKPWELIHTFIVIRWIKTLYDWSGNSLTTIEKMEDICFQTASSRTIKKNKYTMKNTNK